VAQDTKLRLAAAIHRVSGVRVQLSVAVKMGSGEAMTSKSVTLIVARA
jgi:hypothetical protein